MFGVIVGIIITPFVWVIINYKLDEFKEHRDRVKSFKEYRRWNPDQSQPSWVVPRPEGKQLLVSGGSCEWIDRPEDGES